jgi:hypothetical protein
MLLLAHLTTAFAAKWAPIPAEDLAATTPTVDPDAGAEILFREVVITHDSVDSFVYEYHVRAKIFSERGIESFAKIDIPYDNDSTIRGIAVRTVKPDGQILELGKKDIYDREILRAGKDRVKVRSFSPAGLEPGAIVEYTYTELRERWQWYVSMYFQSELPARRVRYKFRMIDLSTLAAVDSAKLTARAVPFNLPLPAMKPDGDGYYTFDQHNVLAAKEEPFSPPRLNTESALIVCYSLDARIAPQLYWSREGKKLHTRMLKETKATKLVTTTLDSIVAPADTPEEKLRKLYDFCRTKLLNRASPVAGFTQAQREKFKSNETVTDTLKAGHGTGEDLNAAFVALARAAGFDARYAAVGDRSFLNFDASITEPFMTSDLIAAVQIDGQWSFFDPGVLYLPYATPHWRNTGTGVLIPAPKDATVIAIQPAPPEVSPLKRKAVFALDADGTLEGDVTVEYDGHQAYSKKWTLHDKGATELTEYIRDEIRENLPLSELTEVKVENAANPLAPLKIAFHLRVPEYADRTGSRLFLQPAVFQKNIPTPLAEKSRRTAVAFNYAYSIADEVRITPPAGYELEQASSPGSLDLGALGTYTSGLGVAKSTGALVYHRKFMLKGIHIALQYYGPVRDAFELIHARDAHTVTLRRKPAAGETAPSTPPASAPAPAAPNPAPTADPAPAAS